MGEMEQRQLGLWIAVGAAVGAVVGLFMENVFLWMAIGVAMGLGMGVLQDRYGSDGS